MDEHVEYTLGVMEQNGAPEPSRSQKTFTPGWFDDPLLWDAANAVVTSRLGSSGHIQRRIKVGYSRAQRMLDTLEELGIVGPKAGNVPREVLVDVEGLSAIKAVRPATLEEPDRSLPTESDRHTVSLQG